MNTAKISPISIPLPNRPLNPVIGDSYSEWASGDVLVYTGSEWVRICASSSSPKINLEPTEEQLEKHPTLKQAWEEYLVVRKLLGL